MISQRSERFQRSRTQLPDGPHNLLRGDDRRRSQKQVVAGEAVDAALHGIDEQTALQGGCGNATGEILLGREWALGRFVSDKFYGPQEADAADIADGGFVAQALEGWFEMGGGGAGRV